ncbi:hypothetical protein LO763_19700 [Glycomyces sp. A-F 0318]|uniref:hypothetical protein n=1 Tax=Glycomyces amatae TaxID=2881355 RepID=UPI001E4757A0|nr:hypothetical protein [Glycomyces amatae]MCD0445837.1 hypothetical protein [Glycomyces amatae]
MTAIRLRGTPEENQAVHDHLASRFTIIKASPDLQRRSRDGAEFWDRYLMLGPDRENPNESAI